MFGEKTFFGIEGTYTYRYCVTDESQIPDTAGRIYDSGGLPGRAIKFNDPSGKKRNWLGQGAMYQRRGTIIEVVETYWLSRAGGWNAVIYGAGSNKAQNTGVTPIQPGSIQPSQQGGVA